MQRRPRPLAPVMLALAALVPGLWPARARADEVTLAPPGPRPPPPPRWTIQVDPLTTALGFVHVQVERALGDSVSLYLGPSVRLFDPLSKETGRYTGVGAEAGLRVFPWGGAPQGAWAEVRGVVARLKTSEGERVTALGGYGSVLAGYTWVLRGRWVLAAGLGAQYIHYRVAGLGSVGFLPAAHSTIGVAFLARFAVPVVRGDVRGVRASGCAPSRSAVEICFHGVMTSEGCAPSRSAVRGMRAGRRPPASRRLLATAPDKPRECRRPTWSRCRRAVQSGQMTGMGQSAP